MQGLTTFKYVLYTVRGRNPTLIVTVEDWNFELVRIWIQVRGDSMKLNNNNPVCFREHKNRILWKSWFDEKRILLDAFSRRASIGKRHGGSLYIGFEGISIEFSEHWASAEASCGPAFYEWTQGVGLSLNQLVPRTAGRSGSCWWMDSITRWRSIIQGRPYPSLRNLSTLPTVPLARCNGS